MLFAREIEICDESDKKAFQSHFQLNCKLYFMTFLLNFLTHA